jgi:hypothetical protein
MEDAMKPFLILCIAALATAALFPEDADARSGVRRSRVVITTPRYRFFSDEPGTIYGYAPGTYVPGPNGMLYGPYRTRVPYVSFGPEGPDFYDWRYQ